MFPNKLRTSFCGRFETYFVRVFQVNLSIGWLHGNVANNGETMFQNFPHMAYMAHVSSEGGELRESR